MSAKINKISDLFFRLQQDSTATSIKACNHQSNKSNKKSLIKNLKLRRSNKKKNDDLMNVNNNNHLNKSNIEKNNNRNNQRKSMKLIS